MLISETERRHVELLAAIVAACLPYDGHIRERADRAVTIALHIRERVRTVYATPEEPAREPEGL